jgi:hypothetical protein
MKKECTKRMKAEIKNEGKITKKKERYEKKEKRLKKDNDRADLSTR